VRFGVIYRIVDRCSLCDPARVYGYWSESTAGNLVQSPHVSCGHGEIALPIIHSDGLVLVSRNARGPLDLQSPVYTLARWSRRRTWAGASSATSVSLDG
jgi:hypothetical protein